MKAIASKWISLYTFLRCKFKLFFVWLLLTDPPPGPLNCSSCAAFSEQSCIAMQTVEQCPAPSPGQEDLVCFTQQASDSNTNQTFFTRGCILPSLCDLVCSSFNNSRGGAIESCSTVCCNTRLCNAGSLPTTQAPTTMVPSTTVQPTTPLGEK